MILTQSHNTESYYTDSHSHIILTQSHYTDSHIIVIQSHYTDSHIILTQLLTVTLFWHSHIILIVTFTLYWHSHIILIQSQSHYT